MEIISLNKSKIAIIEPETGRKDVVVLFIAGISGGVFTKFDKLRNSVIEKGFTYVPIEIWKDSKDVEKLTLRYIFSSIDEVISKLQERGFKVFYAVGKSFGGGVLLARNNPVFEKIILWAPAIGLGDVSTIQNQIDITLDNFESFSEIKLGYDDVSNIKARVTIVQGDKDEIITKSESEKLSDLLPNSEIKIIQGMGHSAKNENGEKTLVDYTIHALEN